VERLFRLEVEEGRAGRGEHDRRKRGVLASGRPRSLKLAVHFLRARRAARVEVVQDLGLLAVRVDRLRVALVSLQDLGLLVEQRLARVSPLGRRKLHKELLVTLDDDGESMVTEAEGLLRLKRDDVVDRDNHLRRKEAAVSATGIGGS
jgi:hypothetical protein